MNQLNVLTLFIYAILKAFLPLPSLEVMLIPLVIKNPLVLTYSIIGAIGTFIGATIGYSIAYFGSKHLLGRFINEKSLRYSKTFVGKYGILSVFIGGITPIPDFILAYGAGLARMNYLAFVVSDAIARFLRSLIVGYIVVSFGYVIDMDKWGTILSLVIMSYFIFKWGFSKADIKSEKI